MMSPEKTTMADMSGGKRDRVSDYADQPVTTPNTRDSKLLCNDNKLAVGNKNDEKTVETEQKLVLVKIDADDFDNHVKEVIDVDSLDTLIASGGKEKQDQDSDTEEHVPKTLFEFDDNKTDDDASDPALKLDANDKAPGSRAPDTKNDMETTDDETIDTCLLITSPSPHNRTRSRMSSSD